MRAVRQITWLWPGLERLWYHGHWNGLAQALAFALLVNTALFVGLIRPDLVPGPVGVGAWVLTFAFWVMGIVQSARNSRRRPRTSDPDNPHDTFRRAQRAYLRGNWADAEALVEALVRENPEDVESHLLLASVQRRTGRPLLARRQLDRAERFDRSGKWLAEIERERDLLDR